MIITYLILETDAKTLVEIHPTQKYDMAFLIYI